MKVIATKTIAGTNSVTGEFQTFKVEAVDREIKSPGNVGRFAIRINGKECSWYAIERYAIAEVNRAKIGYCGISFGRPF